MTFLEPSDRASFFGITGIVCGDLMVVYNDPYDRIEVRKRGNVVTVYCGGKPVINQVVSTASGYVGIYSHYTTMCSEFIIGVAYKYQAREKVDVTLAGHAYSFGRVARTGEAWNGSTFTLSGTREEAASRSTVIDGSIEVFSLGEAAGVSVGSDAALTISYDPGAELITLCLCDSRGGGVVRFRISLDLQELYNRMVYSHGFAGLVLDGLDTEDAAIWGLV